MEIVLAVLFLLGSALALARAYLHRAGRAVERVVTVVNEIGESVTYTLDEAVEQIDALERRREKLLDRLSEAPRTTVKQQRRWDEAYTEAVVTQAVIDSLSGALAATS